MRRSTASPTRWALDCPLMVSARGCLRVAAARLQALLGAQPLATSCGNRLPALPGAVGCRCLPALSCSHRQAATYKHRRRGVASGELHMPTSLHSPSSKEMFTLKLHVASLCFKCFRGKFASVSYGCCKSSWDAAHVAMVVHVCCKLLFSMFHLAFFNVCCKCVYLDVANVFTQMM